MLTKDATWCMPPTPTWFRGVASIRQWLVRDPLSERWQHLPARANGQLAAGCYLFDAGKGRYVPQVIDVLTLDGDKIAAVTAFLAYENQDRPGALSDVDLFARFGLPAEPPRESTNATR
jgi:RNA polymerase sigma-70 factor, ECF subfamily